MAAGHSIPPFPAEIDRDAFGHWLSGFTDGEGCFRLAIHPVKGKNKTFHMPGGRFEIFLRQDDQPILELIRSYWQVGNLQVRPARGTTTAGARFYVSGAPALATVLVPHFERFPLRAKKLADFLIWKRGVALLHAVAERPRVGLSKWTDAERSEFAALHLALKDQRRFTPRP